jgi:hypothetical protein
MTTNAVVSSARLELHGKEVHVVFEFKDDYEAMFRHDAIERDVANHGAFTIRFTGQLK